MSDEWDIYQVNDKDDPIFFFATSTLLHKSNVLSVDALEKVQASL